MCTNNNTGANTNTSISISTIGTNTTSTAKNAATDEQRNNSKRGRTGQQQKRQHKREGLMQGKCRPGNTQNICVHACMVLVLVLVLVPVLVLVLVPVLVLVLVLARVRVLQRAERMRCARRGPITAGGRRASW